MWKYKNFIIKPYVVIHNGYRWSIYDPEERHVGSARNKEDAKYIINSEIRTRGIEAS